MNYLSFFLFLFATSLIVSCGSDDGCTTDDWVGTWAGSVNCDDGTSEMVTVVISKIDESTIQLDIDGDTQNIPVSGCNFDFDGILDTFLGSIDITYKSELNGNQMDFETDIELFGVSLNCAGTLTN